MSKTIVAMWFFVVVMVLGTHTPSWSAPLGTAVTYQGRLTDAGNPANGPYDFQFYLYDASLGGSLLGTETKNGVVLLDGYFDVELNFGSVVFTGEARWLEIEVAPAGSGSFTPLSPRQELTPSPYSLHASSAQTVQVPLELSGALISPNAIIKAENSDANGRAIYGENTAMGNFGYLGGNVVGVQGWGGLAGGRGQTDSGYGLWGRSISGTGVFGEQTTSGNFGYLGTSDYGVYGSSDTDYAGYFEGNVAMVKDGGELVLRTPSRNHPDRFKLRFDHNAIATFLGDDTEDQFFSFYTDFGKNRTYDAHLRAYGKAANSWGNYIEITHDGNVGVIQTDTGDLLLNPAGNVGIGETDPNHRLHVVGNNHGGYFKTLGSAGRAVIGIAPYAGDQRNYGGYFVAQGEDGYGVYGYANHTGDGYCFGGYFRCDGLWGTGVYGKAAGVEGKGIWGYASYAGNAENYGGYFQTEGGRGRGVYGYASNTGNGTNYGGYFQAKGEEGRGVYGYADHAGEVTNYGGYFEARGEEGRGVYGYASNSGDVTNYGGYFEADGDNGRGVYGYASGSGTSSIGVEGNGWAYDFYASGPGVNWGASSSIRWKRNIRVIATPLDKILHLRGVYFDWDSEHGGQHDVGMIAEEVGTILPEIVVYEENGIDANGMDYSKLTPLLVEAVKELKREKDSEIAELKGRFSEMNLLRKENAELRARLAALESVVAKMSPLQTGGL